MIRKVICCCVELIHPLLLVLDVDFFNVKLRCGVDLLQVEIGWHIELMLLVVLFGFLNVERAVHDFDVNFEARRLLLEVRKS